MSVLLVVLAVCAVLALLGGGVAYDRYGYAVWSPLGVLVVVVLVLFLVGVL